MLYRYFKFVFFAVILNTGYNCFSQYIVPDSTFSLDRIAFLTNIGYSSAAQKVKYQPDGKLVVAGACLNDLTTEAQSKFVRCININDITINESKILFS